MNQPLKRIVPILAMGLSMAIWIAGCKKEETISTYSAPKDTAAPALAANTPETPEPMGQAASFEAAFPADLRWALPAGWKQVPVPEKAFFKPVAAIAVSDDQPGLLLTVSQLPDSPGARSISENVARWARQLKMDPPAEADLSKYVTHIDAASAPMDIVTLGGGSASTSKLLGAIVAHAQDTWVFKLSGPQSAVDAQAPAFAEFLKSIHFDSSPQAPVAGPPAPTPASPSDSATGATGLGGAQWALPAGWTVEPGNGFRLATIRPGGNAPAEIKVSKLGPIGGGPGANVSRWHGEVGLPPVDDEHADPGQKAEFNGRPWIIHDYTGPANGGTREIIAVAEVAGATWYFKLAGPTDVIAKIKPEFDQFMATVKLQ